MRRQKNCFRLSCFVIVCLLHDEDVIFFNFPFCLSRIQVQKMANLYACTCELQGSLVQLSVWLKHDCTCKLNCILGNIHVNYYCIIVRFLIFTFQSFLSHRFGIDFD